jgi:hypothetical protein
MSDDDPTTAESPMHDTSTQTDDESAVEEPAERATDPDDPNDPDESSELVSERARRYFDYAVLVALGVLGFVALVQFYLSASNAINRWISPAYRSLFQAAFNLAVLLITGAAISLQFRRMGGE